VQILDGAPPANTASVEAKWLPGRSFRYSGGGTMVLQLLVGEVTGTPFERLAATSVLEPAGMKGSTFTPLATNEANVASAHDLDGQPLAGRFRLYPEQAAAGLWSTAEDLARLALAIAASWRDGGPLTRRTGRLMAAQVVGGPTGLGIFVRQRPGKPPYLYHYGVNAGFRSVLVFAADGAFGLALMTNGEGGRGLIPAFLDAVFRAFGQDEFKPAP
jgi:CubicO group peptidase (beta-lactamase class C family)